MDPDEKYHPNSTAITQSPSGHMRSCTSTRWSCGLKKETKKKKKNHGQKNYGLNDGLMQTNVQTDNVLTDHKQAAGTWTCPEGTFKDGNKKII